MNTGRRPDMTLRDGSVSLSAWCEKGNNGKPWWKTVQLQRSYESPKGSGDWKHGSIGGRDVPIAMMLLQEFYRQALIKSPTADQQAVGSQVDLNKYADVPADAPY